MATLAIAPAVVVLAALGTSLGDAYPRYAVAPDAVVHREYKSSTKLESKPLKLFLDGEEVPPELSGVLRAKVDDTKTIVFTDTIGAIEAGRPTKFVREYDKLENRATETMMATPPGGQEDVKAATNERVSPLAGKSVRFTW